MAFACGDTPAADIGQVALDWMDADLRPRLIVSEALKVLWISQRARTLLDRHRGIFIEDGSLSFIKEQAGRILRSLVQAAGPGMTSAVVPIAPGEHYLFRAWRVASGAEQVLLLEFCLDDEHFRSTYAHIEDVFGLTTMEHTVLSGLLCGSTVTEIATSKSIGLVTVRSHIRGIYNKVGVDSRERLFSRLSAFRVV